MARPKFLDAYQDSSPKEIHYSRRDLWIPASEPWQALGDFVNSPEMREPPIRLYLDYSEIKGPLWGIIEAIIQIVPCNRGLCHFDGISERGEVARCLQANRIPWHLPQGFARLPLTNELSAVRWTPPNFCWRDDGKCRLSPAFWVRGGMRHGGSDQ